MIFRNGRGRLAVALTACLGLAGAAIAAEPSGPGVFKGQWVGPAPGSARPPGPGPAPGQSLAAYFANLKTGPRSPKRFHVLVLGGTRGFHHDSASASMAAVYRWGEATGLWDAELMTDFSLVNPGGGGPMNAGFQPKGLKDFDAVVVANASGDWGLTAEQKAALVGFVRDRGKGLVVIHAGIDANHNWRDYIDMVGGEFVGHPFNTVEDVVVNFPLANEDPAFPAVSHLPKAFRKQDELYVLRNFARGEVDVLLRLDERRLDFSTVEGRVPPDHDMPVAWAKAYGKGRVFASSIGHTRESFEDPDVARMYAEAIEWALGLTDADVASHPRRN
jgi:type 1 glutamine amidotransferase